jgi:hypothetical protein
MTVKVQEVKFIMESWCWVTYDKVSMMRLSGQQKKQFYLLALPAADGMQMTRAKPKYS